MPLPNFEGFPSFDVRDPIPRNPPVPDSFKPSLPGPIVKYTAPPSPSLSGFSAPPPTISKPSIPVTATGGRIAGTFKRPIASGLAARGAGKFAGRAIPIVGALLVAYDLYELGCAFQLLPGSICPRPDNPEPGGQSPGFNGGQCPCILYNVTVAFTYDGSTLPGDQLTTARTFVQMFGPMGGTRTIELSPNSDGTTRTRIEIFCAGLNGETCKPSGVWRTLVDSVTNYRFHNLEIVVRADGQLDNCGNPSPSPQDRLPPEFINNINIHRNNINLNITVEKPGVPSPIPKRAPIVISPPSPLPDININFNNNDFGSNQPNISINFNFSSNPSINFNDQPDIYNNFPPSPQPKPPAPDPVPKTNPSPTPAPKLPSIPEVPPPIPDKLPDNSTEEDKYIYRQNKETLDKLYKANAEILEIQAEQLQQRKILENIQSLLDFEVQGSQLINRCDGIETFYSYKDKVLRAIHKQMNYVTAIEQTIINEICDVQKESVVAIPEWWQARIKNNVPQIALVFRSLGTKTYYKLNIPHPLNTTKPTLPPIAGYLKGNWQAQLVLIDNSKFIINCQTKDEAERVTLIALSLIDPTFLGNNPKLYFAERRGVEISQTTMQATSAMYFSTGQQNLKPDWHVAFK